MTFQYVARDPLGKLLRGSIEAESREMAEQLLYRDGFQVVKLSSDRGGGVNLFAPRISKSEIINLTNQLSIMTDTGITLSAALDGVLEQSDNATLKRVLSDLKSCVEAGEDFSLALSRHPKHFDNTYIALIRASEETGGLPEALEQIATDMRKDLESRSRVRSALAYPTVMLCLAVAVTFFLLTFVLPKFAPIFTKKGIQLPTPTLFMMKLSDALMHYWFVWIAVAGVLVIAFLVGRRTQPGRRAIDYSKINLPILGGLFRKVIIGRSLRTLGTMVFNGVQMLDAIQRTADVCGNHYYRQVWLNVMNEVTNGSRICESLAESPLFPKTLVQMIGSGEETGKLDAVLAKVSAHYEGEVETSLKTVTSLLEPMMIVIMGVVVGGIGMALLLPIFSLSRGM